MKTLAKALINLTAFVELSGDETINPDSAVQALEQLSYDLSEATPGEIEYLKAVIRERIGKLPLDSRTPQDQIRVDFLLNFLENIGIEKTKA